MRKHILFFMMAGFLLSFSITAHSGTESHSRIITIRSDSWPPYNGEPSSSAPGSMIDIMKCIFEKKGYTIDYQLMPWNRSIVFVEEGRYDAIVGAYLECPGCCTPREPIGMMETHFYVRKENAWRYNGLDSLSNISVGVISNYSYSASFDAYIEKHKTDRRKVDVMTGDNPLQRNIKKLLDRRIGTLVENPLVICWVLKEMNMKAGDLQDAGELENSRLPLYVKFSGKKTSSKTYADLFDKGIVELRKSGVLKKILAKYNMTDWK